MNVEKRLKELGYELPQAPAKGGIYTPCKTFGENLAYVSGCGPAINGTVITGKVGKDITLEQGQEAAVNCMLNVLAVIKAELGDLDRVKKFAKALVFVSSDSEFYEQPQVANTASSLLVELYGEEIGSAARSAIGVNVLPGNISVEIEVLFEYE